MFVISSLDSSSLTIKSIAIKAYSSKGMFSNLSSLYKCFLNTFAF
jgi:hypothetical protein